MGDSNAKTAGGDIVASKEILYTVNCGFKPSAVSIIYKPDSYIRVCTYNSEQSTTKYYFSNYSVNSLTSHPLCNSVDASTSIIAFNITNNGFSFYRPSGSVATIHWIAKE